MTRDVDTSLYSDFKNATGKIATPLAQTSRWYAEGTKRFKMKEYERV